MGAKTVLFVVLFAASVLGGLFTPLLPILGYMLHYCLGPERQWWIVPLNPLGIRYSLTMALAAAVGIVLYYHRLGVGSRFLVTQEKLLLLFLGVIWLTVLIGPATTGTFYANIDHPSVKMLKIIIFALMLTHVVTRLKSLNALFWVLVVGVLILGLQAYYEPRSNFNEGRLETVGGTDFAESNVLGAFMATMLPFVGVQFFRSRWWGKIICLFAGVFGANAIVLTRSRGAVVGLAAGAVVTLLLAPRRHRLKLSLGLAVAIAGGYYLADEPFKERTATINQPAEERDSSSRDRIETWDAALSMLADHPLGVGTGNFQQFIGLYNSKYTGRDAHSTFVRCFGELGIPGIALFAFLIVNGFLTVRRVIKRSQTLAQPYRDQVFYAAYGVAVGMATLLASGFTLTLIYDEFLWWILVLPACLERVVENVETELQPVKVAAADGKGKPGKKAAARAGAAA